MWPHLAGSASARAGKGRRLKAARVDLPFRVPPLKLLIVPQCPPSETRHDGHHEYEEHYDHKPCGIQPWITITKPNRRKEQKPEENSESPRTLIAAHDLVTPSHTPGIIDLSVLSTCVTKQTKDMRFTTKRNPDGSSALVLRTMMRYALERESYRGSTPAVPFELPKEGDVSCARSSQQLTPAQTCRNDYRRAASALH